MKAEKKGNEKKLVWLCIAAAAILVLAGICLALFLPGSSQQNAPTGPAVLYWNVDGWSYTENSETGLTERQPDADGLYHVRFAVDGQQIEMTVVNDRQLVNYIDSMQVMGLVMDADGIVVDAVDPKTVATETAKDAYVKEVGTDTVLINTSKAMNGMEIELAVSDITGIYDVNRTAEVIGQPGQLQIMDKVTVYSQLEGEAVTHIYITEHPVDAGIYWRVERCWNADKGETSREPDENGIYNLEFAHDGAVVNLKCREKGLVDKIDGAALMYGQFALQFDEEGYIIALADVGTAIRGVLLASDFHITGIDGDTYTATRLSSGSDQGRTVSFKLVEDCDIFQCCQYGCYDHNCGERTDFLQLYDRVNIYTDLDGQAKLIFISRRCVDSPMYFNFNRQYDANGTTRTKVGGSYVFELLKDGNVVTVRTSDKAIADKMDSIYNGCMGLKLDGDVVERVYDATCVAGGSPLNSQGVVSSIMGPVIQISGSTGKENGNALLSSDCKVYNAITGEYGKKVGGTLTLQVGDQVTSYRNCANEICIIFVLARQAEGAKVYYNLNRSYDNEKQQTKRMPDQEGYYIFEMACEGKLVTVKTKSKGMASFIDKQQAPLVGLKVNSSGVVTSAYAVTSALKNAAKACNYRYVENVTKTTFNTFYYPAATPNVKKADKDTYKMADNCVVYNVSTTYTKQRGEKTTLKNGDYIQAIKDITTDEIIQIFIMQRDPTYGVASYKANCSHCGKNVTWKPYNGRIPSEDAHFFVCDDLTFSQGIIGKKDDGKTYDIVLDLKGHTLTGAGRAFLVYDKLTVMDTKSGGKIVGTSTGIGLAGGSIMVGDGGILNLYGGELTLSNKSTAYGTGGGVLYIGGKGATVNMTGGKITGGVSTDRGGNVVIYGGCFNMSGGVIEGGKAPSGDNIYASSWSKINLTGGKIDGGVYILNNSTVTLSGKPVVSGTGMEIVSLKMDISGLLKGASIVLSGNGVFTNELTNPESYLQYFTTAAEGDSITVEGNALSYTKQPVDYNDVQNTRLSFAAGTNNAYCPVCDDTVTWTAISADDAITLVAGKHYYLAQDLTYNGETSFLTAPGAGAVCVHLNDHNITARTQRVFQGSGGTLNIMGNGTVTGNYTTGDYVLAGTVGINTSVASGTVNLIGGTYVSGTAAPVVSISANGGNINIYEGATICGDADTRSIYVGRAELVNAALTIYGGTVEGGSVFMTGANTAKGNEATFAVLGGKITGGIQINKNSAFTLSGSPVISGVPLKISTGVKIKLGEMTDGASVLVSASGIFTEECSNVESYKNYFEPVETEHAIEVSDNALNYVIPGQNIGFVLDPDGDGKAVCPVCGGDEVQWTAISGTGSVSVTSGAHYYMAEDIESKAGAYMTLSAKSACLHLNGHDLTYAGRIFLTTANASLFSKLNIMGSGVVTSTGTDGNYATGTIHLAGTVELNLYGGVYRYEGSTYAPIRLAAANAVANVYGDAVIDGGSGTAALVEKGKFNMHGGTAIGRINATAGTVTLDSTAAADSINIGAGAKLTVNAGWSGTARVAFASALVNNAVPAANGASTGAYSGKLTLQVEGDPALYGKDGLLVTDGSKPDDDDDDDTFNKLKLDDAGYGYCAACKATVQWIDLNTKSDPRMGSKNDKTTYESTGTKPTYHYYLSNDLDCISPYLFAERYYNTNCLHLNGHSLTIKSMIRLGTGVVMNVLGSGSLTTSCTSTSASNNSALFYINSGAVLNLYSGTYVSTNANAPVVLIPDSEATVVNIYDAIVTGGITAKKGTVTLNGNCEVDSISIAANAKLEVNAEWSGTAAVSFESALIGNAVPEVNGASTGAYTGKLMLNAEGSPELFGMDNLLVTAAYGKLELNADGSGYCEACKETVQWIDLNANSDPRIGNKNDKTTYESTGKTPSYHFYLSDDLNCASEYRYAERYYNTTCLHLNGHSLTIKSMFRVGTKGILNILGSGTITSTCNSTTASNRTSLYNINGGGIVNLHGGSHISANSASPAALINDTATSALNIYNRTSVSGGITAKNGSVCLSGASNVDCISIAAAAKLVVKEDFNGSACADFAALDNNIIPEANGVSEGAYTGKLYLRKEGNELIVGEDGKLAVKTTDDE